MMSRRSGAEGAAGLVRRRQEVLPRAHGPEARDAELVRHRTGDLRLGQIIDSTGTVSPAVVGGLEPQSRLGISALLASCGAAASEDAGNAGECTGMPMIDALSSQAGIALRTGSTQLAALPPWPESVRVVSLAGDIRVTIASVLGSRTGSVSLGDIIVAPPSAEAGVDDYVVSTCYYTLLSMPDVP